MLQEVIRYMGPHQSSSGTVLGELDHSGCGAESCLALLKETRKAAIGTQRMKYCPVL